MAETTSQLSGSPVGSKDLLFTPRASFAPCFPHIVGDSPAIGISGYGGSSEDHYDLLAQDHAQQQKNQGAGHLDANKPLTVLNSRLIPPHTPINRKIPSQTPSVGSQASEDVENPTQFLVIGGLPAHVPPHRLFGFFQEHGDVRDFDTVKLHSQGICMVSYMDLRDSAITINVIKEEEQFAVHYCTDHLFYKVLEQNECELTGSGMAQVRCTVISGVRNQNLAALLYNCLSTFGKIGQIKYKQGAQPVFLVSFTDMDVEDSSDIVDTLDGQYIDGVRVKVDLPQDDLMFQKFNDLLIEHTKSMSSSGDIWSPTPINPGYGIPKTYSLSTVTQPWDTPTGRSVTQSPGTPSQNWNYNQAQGVDRQGDSPFRMDRGRAHLRQKSTSNAFDSPTSSSTVSGKNIINLDRIARGLDTRTTVMLRNIPNKVDLQTLKEYIDETSRGLYNFLYLRIDFKNVCNVGYAFINFLDPLDLIDFVKAKSGTRWNKFNSDKILDVTYANMQGIDHLVDKFRNSSVMDQDPAYRPKLYYSAGPLAGTEMEFPGPNNILKKCRSITSAQQIGLFAPKISPSSKGVWRKQE